jgi:predicted transcriptional regulator
MKKIAASEFVVNGSKCNIVLQSVLNLNKLEVHIYRILEREGPMRSSDLAKLIGKDRSTAYRCLKNLVACDICEKKVFSLEKGGYYHMYSAISLEEIKGTLKECTKQWYQATCAAIDEFPYDE